MRRTLEVTKAGQVHRVPIRSNLVVETIERQERTIEAQRGALTAMEAARDEARATVRALCASRWVRLLFVLSPVLRCVRDPRPKRPRIVKPTNTLREAVPQSAEAGA